MGIWFLAYLTTPFQNGHIRIRVLDFNMKAQHELYPKDLTTPFRNGHIRIRVLDFNMKAQRELYPKDLTAWLTREPFNVFTLFLLGVW